MKKIDVLSFWRKKETEVANSQNVEDGVLFKWAEKKSIGNVLFGFALRDLSKYPKLLQNDNLKLLEKGFLTPPANFNIFNTSQENNLYINSNEKEISEIKEKFSGYMKKEVSKDAFIFFLQKKSSTFLRQGRVEYQEARTQKSKSSKKINTLRIPLKQEMHFLDELKKAGFKSFKSHHKKGKQLKP